MYTYCILSPDCFSFTSHEDAFRKTLGAKQNAEVRKELAAKRRMLQKAENRLAELGSAG